MSLFVPSVFRMYVLQALENRLVMSRVSNDITAQVPQVTIQGKEIDFPVISRTVQAQVIPYQGSITLDELDMTNSTAPIQHISAGFKIHQDDLRRSRESLLQSGITSIADELAVKFDRLLVDKVYNDAVLRSPASDAVDLTEGDLNRALGLFGDKRNIAEFAGIIVHSETLPSLYAMDSFVNNNLTFTTTGSGKIANQVVGSYQGIPVMLSNNGTKINGECMTQIIKRGGLAYIFQKRIVYSEDYILKDFMHQVAASMYLATKIIDTDKVVVLKKTIA